MTRQEVLNEIVRLCKWDLGNSLENYVEFCKDATSHTILVAVEEPESVEQIYEMLLDSVPVWALDNIGEYWVRLITGTSVTVKVATPTSLRGASPTILWIDGFFKKDIADQLNGLPRKDKQGNFNIYRTYGS